MYICPICGLKLNIVGNKYICPKNHSFDKARQGYVNLILANGKKSLSPGDNELMTTARREFLKEGYYEKLLQRLCEILVQNEVKTLVDSGCSEGYYTKSMANVVERVFAYDISKSAVKLASANDKKTNYFVASAFHIPLENACAGAVTKIFAPDSTQEFYRILKEDGILLEVIPNANHLIELKQALYKEVYLNKVEEAKKHPFSLLSEEVLKYKFTPTKEGLENLFKMTPYYYKTPKEGRDNLLNQKNLEITADFIIRTYKKTI